MARRTPAESLARWMHAIWAQGHPEGYEEPWGHLSKWRQAFYLRVAERLIEEPPPELRKVRRRKRQAT